MRPRAQHWVASGWLLKGGHVIQMSCMLPGGICAEVRRSENKRTWGWRIRGHFDHRISRHAPYRSRWQAAAACETALASELRRALRMIKNERDRRRSRRPKSRKD